MFTKLNLSILFISLIFGYVFFNIFFNVFIYENFSNKNPPQVGDEESDNEESDDEESDDEESDDEESDEGDEDSKPAIKKKANKNNIQTHEIYAISNNKIYNSSMPCEINNKESMDCSWNNIDTKTFTPTKVYHGKNDIWAIDNVSNKKKTGIYRCNKPCTGKWESIPILNNGIITDLYIDDNKNYVYGIDSYNKIYKCDNNLDRKNVSSCTKNNNWGLSKPAEKVTIINYIKANPTREILFNPNSDQSREIYATSKNKIYKYSLNCGITNKGGNECRWDTIDTKNIDTTNFTPTTVYQGKNDILVSDKEKPDMYTCKKPCAGNWITYNNNTTMDNIKKIPIREIIFNSYNYLTK